MEAVEELSSKETIICNEDVVSTEIISSEKPCNEPNGLPLVESIVNCEQEKEVNDTDDTISNEQASNKSDEADLPKAEPMDVGLETQELNINTNEEITEVIIDNSEVQESEAIETNDTSIVVSSKSEGIIFETEIVVEQNIENGISEVSVDQTDSSNYLGDIEKGIELNEALRSSDTSNTVDNNNAIPQQELFNKEELLNILEGDSPPDKVDVTNVSEYDIKAQVALQQLSELKVVKRRVKKPKKTVNTPKTPKTPNIPDDVHREVLNIKFLVKDWEDDEIDEENSLNKNDDDSISSNNSQNEVINNSLSQNDQLTVNESEKALSNGQSIEIKSEDEQPHRRHSRVIKKKIIYDPDNPDTFTKAKTPNIKKEIKKDATEKEPTLVKVKLSETTQQVRKSKSPIKMQWKKPTIKNSRQCKRLSEVDKLLMDEGAVNMMYQLTPDATKKGQNIRNKAELIKKLQNTPDKTEMKFRERKKEGKHDSDDTPKRVGGNKQRSSMSSSVKSFTNLEEFETHSADDSIIYRRHSSSSYSSSCMSPRRMSEVDSTSKTANSTESSANTKDFLSTCDTINKNDCLSIKEKLNSKLSQILNKRKSEASKADKPSKIKKYSKKDRIVKDLNIGVEDELDTSKLLSITFDQHLAEICIYQTGPEYLTETVKELDRALAYIESKKDISVTLLTSKSGQLCTNIDWGSLVTEDVKQRSILAYEFAEKARTLLCSLDQHSKLLCTGVWGDCTGLTLPIMALCDVNIASENATFSLGASNANCLLPGYSVFTVHSQLFQKHLIKDLLLFNRRLSASEATQAGLVSRTVCSSSRDASLEMSRAVAKDLSSQPLQNILLKKQLLSLKRRQSQSTFLSCLEGERDLLHEYWTSTEGQELIRSTFTTDP